MIKLLTVLISSLILIGCGKGVNVGENGNGDAGNNGSAAPAVVDVPVPSEPSDEGEGNEEGPALELRGKACQYDYVYRTGLNAYDYTLTLSHGKDSFIMPHGTQALYNASGKKLLCVINWNEDNHTLSYNNVVNGTNGYVVLQ